MAPQSLRRAAAAHCHTENDSAVQYCYCDIACGNRADAHVYCTQLRAVWWRAEQTILKKAAAAAATNNLPGWCASAVQVHSPSSVMLFPDSVMTLMRLSRCRKAPTAAQLASVRPQPVHAGTQTHTHSAETHKHMTAQECFRGCCLADMDTVTQQSVNASNMMMPSSTSGVCGVLQCIPLMMCCPRGLPGKYMNL